ncbi:MAG: NADH-quinone oxidoreductase subunit J [Oligoflexia bacterium]|nr:NADH-quinone oxidoreductase subunit J [Oligoflexia bacterium]
MISQATETLLFYLFATVSVGLALATVLSQRILRAAVYLMGVLVTSAAFYILLGAEFLAGVQILVYVGGIVILLVYAVMLTRSSELLEDHPSFVRKGVAFVAASAFFALATGVFSATRIGTAGDGHAPAAVADTTLEIGRRLLDQGATGYVIPFEIISLLLLSVLIGGSVIARRSLAKAEETK